MLCLADGRPWNCFPNQPAEGWTLTHNPFVCIRLVIESRDRWELIAWPVPGSLGWCSTSRRPFQEPSLSNSVCTALVGNKPRLLTIEMLKHLDYDFEAIQDRYFSTRSPSDDVMYVSCQSFQPLYPSITMVSSCILFSFFWRRKANHN